MMTRFGQTHGYSANDHVKEIEKYIGGRKVDICLVHKDGGFPKSVLKKYEEEKAFPVKDDLNIIRGRSLKAVRQNLVSNIVFEKAKSDKLHRSLIRHDSDKLAKAIISLL